MRPPAIGRQAACLATLMAFSGTVLAHSEFSAVRPFWSGVLHFLVSPLAVAAVFGLVAALAASREEGMLWAACLAGLSALAASRFGVDWPAWTGAAGAVVAGLFAAAGRPPSPLLASLLAIAAGTAAGRATELDAPEWSATVGVAFAVSYLGLLGVASLWALELRQRVVLAIRIGRRVIGAWVAAIGLLLGALAFRSAA